MKIIFNKYGGLKTIEDRQLLVQSSDNANYVDIYYQDENGNFADETVNLATIAFKRADSFEIMEKTCDAVREELTNKLLYFRYVFQEDDLAVNGELQITVRLKQVVFDPEDETQILLIKQRAMGKLVAHIYEAIGTDYEYYNVIDGRLLQLELWQSTFDGTYYDVTQIDAIVAQEVLNRNNAINDHNSNANAHASIRQEITDLENDLQGQIDGIDNTLQNHESRIGELELFAGNLETNITEEIEGALENKADLVNGKVPREQLPSFVDDIIEGFYINGQFYSEGVESPEYLITPEFGKLYVEVDTNKMYRSLGGTYEEIPSPFELTKAKVEAVLTGDITSHNHATEIGNHNTSETAHSDIRQAITAIQTIIAAIDGEPDADSVINKLHEIVALLNGYAEGTTLADLLSGKVDKIDGKGLTKNELTDVLVEAYNAAYTHSQSDHAPTNAQANVIEGVQVNGVDLSVANKKVNVTVPTIPDISLNDDQATAGKYISKIEVDATDKHKLIVTKADLPQGFSGDYEDLTNVPDEFTPTEHNHDSNYYKKSETYTKAQIDTLVGDLAGETQELKSITTEPSGTFVYGDKYYNSSTKGLYYYTGSAWELTGLGEPIAGVIYSFNGTLYFWNETEADLIQIGGGVDLSNYYTKTEIDAKFDNLLGGEY